ncbi:thioredoxin family protein [Pelotomaculum propionicicum]|uniref:Thioredoxin C-1 n=1 Tax=Pelotomaculum propionicicum TaxID=258475 RepID=A0A4Y7RNT2_9FIRM|nr:thioredoxin family protein [Pelotomaculum propionicicum]TEB10332.1 Thioredoxin C-1 [Pelotomaculum propionicicum]
MELKKLNAVTFEEVVYDNCETCLVAFSRKSCHVCKEVIPLVEDIAEEYVGKFGFYSVDVEEEKDLYNRFSLRGVPSLLFFKDGEYQGKLAGQLEEEQIKDKINTLVG